MAARLPIWEMAHMAKGDVPPGISARLDHLLELARPAGLSERQFCIQSKVSTSFFTDLRNGRDPSIDRVERLANRAGLRLSQLVDGADATRAGRLAVPIALPSEERLADMMSALLKSVGLEKEADARAGELAQLLPTALEAAGAALVQPESDEAPSRGARPPRAAK
jgi:transcriptional regulator with XRE-family HTH domain